MKKIFTNSYWLWVISKIILIVLLLVSTLSMFGLERLKTDELLICLLGLAEAVLLIITLFNDFSSTPKYQMVKMIAGGILVLLGIGLFVTLLTVSKGSRSDLYFLGFPFSIWMILIGIFDLLRIEKPIPLDD